MKISIEELKKRAKGLFSLIPGVAGGLDKKKMIAISVACFVLLYIDLNFVIRRQMDYIKQAGPKIVRLNGDIANLSKELSAFKDLAAKRQIMKQQGKLRIKNIISEEQIPALLQLISDAANRNKVSLMQMRPSRQAAPKAQAAGKYTPLSIMLNLSGPYHNIGKFINDLESAQDFISVEEVRITPDAGTEFKQGAYVLLKTYFEK